VVILELIHALNLDSPRRGEMYLLDKNQPGLVRFSVVIHDNFANRKTNVGDGSFKFLPYQLSMVG